MAMSLRSSEVETGIRRDAVAFLRSLREAGYSIRIGPDADLRPGELTIYRPGFPGLYDLGCSPEVREALRAILRPRRCPGCGGRAYVWGAGDPPHRQCWKCGRSIAP